MTERHLGCIEVGMYEREEGVGVKSLFEVLGTI